MRSLHKAWQNQRPGFTRRVRWYRPGGENEQIRLQMEEYGEVWNEFYATPEQAQAAYEAFIEVSEAVVPFDRD